MHAVRSPRVVLVLVAAAAVAPGCRRSAGASSGACGRLAGVWSGETVEADAGADPDALRVMHQVVRDERWRILRVTPTGLQRERVGAAGGRPVAEAMYVRRESATRCDVDLTTAGGARPLELELRPGGRLAVRNPRGWFTAVYHRE